MAEVKGKLCSCDLCGRQIFLKCTGEGERDGGFTRWNTFEPYPEGWSYETPIGRMCPYCNAEYNRLIEKLKREREGIFHGAVEVVEVQE